MDYYLDDRTLCLRGAELFVHFWSSVLNKKRTDEL